MKVMCITNKALNEFDKDAPELVVGKTYTPVDLIHQDDMYYYELAEFPNGIDIYNVEAFVPTSDINEKGMIREYQTKKQAV